MGSRKDGPGELPLDPDYLFGLEPPSWVAIESEDLKESPAQSH